MSYNQSMNARQQKIYILLANINKCNRGTVKFIEMYNRLNVSIMQYNKASKEHAVEQRFDYFKRCELIDRTADRPLKVVFEWSVV